ncbi:50S ribosomal protein L32 [Chloroflexota bacterium]
MGALPKRKIAKARRGERRSHLKTTPLSTINCPQCNSPVLPHHACPTCGSYKGRDVIKIKSPKPKTS